MTGGKGSNFILTAVGMKRSGKSHLLASFARRFPRRLVFDFLGEHAGLDGAHEAVTLAETVDALKRVRHKERWTVVSMVDAREVPSILSTMATRRGSFSLAVGGVVIECGEVDLIAPNNESVAQPVRDMFLRGRHFALSVLCATQRPRQMHRIATAQSDVICVFRQHEPRDISYLSEITRGDIEKLVRELPPFFHLRYMPNFDRLDVVDSYGAVVRTV